MKFFLEELIEMMILFIVSIFLIFSLGMLIGPLNGEYTSIQYIDSIERGQETNGGFVLGFGTVNSQIVYYAYSRVGDNSYKLITLPNVTITESDDIHPQYRKEVKCKESHWFGFKKSLLGGQFYRCDPELRQIFVPKGTIQKEFNL